jgi:hypothetical protein
MKTLSIGLFLSLVVGGSVSAKHDWEGRLWHGDYNPHPQNPRKCSVPHKDGADDSAKIVEVFKRCNTNSEIVFEDGVKYNAWSPMKWDNLSAYLSLYCLQLVTCSR